jgi:hypothetical protein
MRIGYPSRSRMREPRLDLPDPVTGERVAHLL